MPILEPARGNEPRTVPVQGAERACRRGGVTPPEAEARARVSRWGRPSFSASLLRSPIWSYRANRPACGARRVRLDIDKLASTDCMARLTRIMRQFQSLPWGCPVGCNDYVPLNLRFSASSFRHREEEKSFEIDPLEQGVAGGTGLGEVIVSRIDQRGPGRSLVSAIAVNVLRIAGHRT